MKRDVAALFIWSSLLLLSSTNANAQEAGPNFIPQNAEGVDDSKGSGWHPLLRFAGNVALGQSENVPGTPDGLSLRLGYIIAAGLDFLSEKKRNEWTNILGMELAYTRTPVVDAFVKSVDKIDFKSTYLYHPTKLPWLGPFVSLRLSAPMLAGYEVRADDSNVLKLEPKDEQAFNDAGEPVDADGQVITAGHASVEQINGGDRIDLTDAFAPLTLRESVGVFAIPLDKPWLKTDFRLGFGAWETFVRDGFFIDDNEDTADLLELRRMQDSVQIGPELGIMLKGAYKENLNYAASALFMQPIYQHQGEESELSGVELMNMEFDVALGVKITKYFSIDYSFKAYKQPLIIDKWQIQNNLLLTIAFEVPAPPTPPPACPPPPECPAVAPAEPSTGTATDAAPETPTEATNPADTTAPSASESPTEPATEPSSDQPTDPAVPAEGETPPAEAPEGPTAEAEPVEGAPAE